MVIGTPSVVRRASFGVEVRDYQREDHAGRVGVALIIGQGCETAPQENDVHPEVVAGHRCFVESCARAAINARLTREDSAIDDQQWWTAHAPLLARFLDAQAYPRAARIGAAAGAAHGSAHNPHDAYEFGLQRTLDAIAALLG